MIDKMELSARALELRSQFGEDANSPIDIYALINQIPELTLVMYPLGEHISGMCIRDGDIKLVAVNSSMSYGRQRFSLAHELYHLYYDENEGFSVCAKKIETDKGIEKTADQFASYFLAPYSALRAAVQKRRAGKVALTLKDVISLEQYFGMSHQAMLWRLIEDNFLTKTQADSMRIGVMSAAKSFGYDERLYLPTEMRLQQRTYGYYIQQAEILKEKGLISSGKYDELLLDAFRYDIVYGDDETGGELID